ncbi:alpha/beta hydrolase [Elizabethkingia meningoseptica]
MKKLFILSLMVNLSSLHAQIKIILKSVPETTPVNAVLYMASSLNQWNPKDENFIFHKNENGNPEITIQNQDKPIEFKVTQGSWDLSEADEKGNATENHKISASTTPQVIELVIKNWTSVQQKQHTAASNVIVLDEKFNIPQLNTSRRVWVYLPPDYKSSGKKYPVIYMHDGQNLFDDATSFSGEWGIDETLNQLWNEHQFSAIVVGVDNGGDKRLDEYSPWKNEHYQKGGEGDLYLDFLATTLKPYIDKHYRSLPQPKNTALIGSSMGGLISFYGGLKYPDIFGRIGVFSPAFWFVSDDLQTFITAHHKNLKQSKFYFLAGKQEDDTMVPQMENMEKLLFQSVPRNHVFSKIDEEGTHSEHFWKGEFANAVLWLYAK